jgi:hypothetical protein
MSVRDDHVNADSIFCILRSEILSLLDEAGPGAGIYVTIGGFTQGGLLRRVRRVDATLIILDCISHLDGKSPSRWILDTRVLSVCFYPMLAGKHATPIEFQGVN